MEMDYIQLSVRIFTCKKAFYCFCFVSYEANKSVKKSKYLNKSAKLNSLICSVQDILHVKSIFNSYHVCLQQQVDTNHGKSMTQIMKLITLSVKVNKYKV